MGRRKGLRCRIVKRRPRGYVGRNHETLGSDVLAVLKAVTLPERTLGPDLARRLGAVRADRWYPIGLLLEAFEVMDAKLGDYGLHHVGWELFKLSHADACARTCTLRSSCSVDLTPSTSASTAARTAVGGRCWCSSRGMRSSRRPPLTTARWRRGSWRRRCARWASASRSASPSASARARSPVTSCCAPRSPTSAGP